MKPIELIYKLFLYESLGYYIYFEKPYRAIVFMPGSFKSLDGRNVGTIIIESIMSSTGLVSWAISIMKQDLENKKFREIHIPSLLTDGNSSVRRLARLMHLKKDGVYHDYCNKKKI